VGWDPEKIMSLDLRRRANDSAALSEAIKSMFRWYMNAAVRCAYLADDTAGEDLTDASSQSGFSRSRWHSHG
jgi:hypothetical protein